MIDTLWLKVRLLNEQYTKLEKVKNPDLRNITLLNFYHEWIKETKNEILELMKNGKS